MSCPAAITIAGVEYFCQNVVVPHNSLKRHWTNAGSPPEPTYWTQDVTPPEPLTLVEWLEQEVPKRGLLADNDFRAMARNNGRQAVLDAASRWVPPVTTVDLDALVEVLPPPIPDVVGTIVRDHSGEAWQREIGVWKCVGGPYRYSLAEVQRRYGPLTVLWPTSDAT